MVWCRARHSFRVAAIPPSETSNNKALIEATAHIEQVFFGDQLVVTERP